MMIEDEELRNLYKISSAECLQKLQAGLQHLQEHPNDEVTLDELRRDAHSLKGDSRSVGVEPVEILIHQVEEIIRNLKRQQIVLTPQLSDRIDRGLDAIDLLVREALTGQPSGVDTAFMVNYLMGAVSEAKPPQPDAVKAYGNPLPVAASSLADQELRNLYQISSGERLQRLQASWQHLQKHPDDETTLAELRRDAHSLKADSRSLGIEPVETCAHCLEEIIVSIKDQQAFLTPQLSDRFTQGLEAISLLVEEAVSGQPSGVDVDEILTQLMVAVSEPQQPQLEAVAANGNVVPVAASFIEDEELRNLYQISSVERLQKLHAGLQYLQEHPDDEAILEELRREAHSFKGDSRSVGVETVATLADCLEEILLSIKDQQAILTPQLSDRFSQGLDAISLLVEESVSGQPSGVDANEVLSQLITVVPDRSQLQPEADAAKGKAVPLAASFIEDAELREVYKITTRGRLQRLQESLQYLQKYPEDPATLEQLRREIHSLKGDSTSVEVETVANLAHCLEEIVLGIKNQQTVFSPELSDRFERGLDAISLLVEEAVTGQPSEVDVDDILHHLMTEVSDLHQPQPQPNPDNGHTHQVAASFIEDAELRDVYKISSQERLQKLEAGLLLLEKQPDDEATLEYLLREAHSLKGDSRSVGATNVETLIHQIEEVLLSIKHQETLLTSQLSDRLYYGLDAITLLVQEAVTGQPSGVDTAFALKHLMASIVAPTLRESQLVPPTEPSLPVKTSAKTVLQELPSIVVGEPYRIDTIRVETRELDALMSQAEELTVTRISIAHATAAIEEMAILWQDWKTFRTHGQRDLSSWGTNPYEERLEKVLDSLRLSAQENSTKLDLIAGELGEKIRTLRLLPLSTVFQVFPRMVRDLAKQQAKQVELVIEGGETTADKGILEEIKDSLMHMIRNAIDHGIETPEEREGLGKPSVATIWLRGYRDGNNIVIEVADDGRGLDVKKIKQTAIKRGLYRKEELATMTPSQIHALILAPGFSTRTFITEISGRGIGLDVVRTNVERFKGNIQIESTPGQGCTFRLQLGTTLATLNALFLEVQGIVHALPIEFVQTTLLVSPDEISTVEGRETIIFDGQEVVVVNLADLLELSNSPAYASTARVDNQLRSKGLIAGKGTREAGGVLPVTGMRYEQHKSDLRSLILLKVGEELAGFFVDRLWDTQEVVLKPQSPLLKRVRNVTGATILPTGEVCTILNPPDLIKSSQKQVTSTASITPKETVKRKPVILLVEDSLPVRTQERRLLEGAGYEVVIAVDGLDGYNKLKTREFDAVVSDVEMPNLDGFSLTGKIRQQEEYDELPIILVTTLDSDEDKRRGATAGANAYIIKGKFNQDFLLETLRKLV